MTVLGGFIHKIGILNLGGGVPNTLGFTPDRMAITQGSGIPNSISARQYHESQINGNEEGVATGHLSTGVVKKGCIAETGVMKWHEIYVVTNNHSQPADYYFNVDNAELANTLTIINATTGSYSDNTECAVTQGEFLKCQRDTSPVATGYISESHLLAGFVYDS